MERGADLSEVRDTGGAALCGANFHQSGEQQREENRENRKCNQDFNEGERGAEPARHTFGANKLFAASL